MKNDLQKPEPFDFRSWGANIRISSENDDLDAWARDIATRALVGNISDAAPNAQFASVFDISYDDEGRVKIFQDGVLEGLDKERKYLEKYFNSLVRVAVAENATDHLFMHAGALGWKGSGIILPATSFAGKSTLVAELVRLGADYYSDDYAIFDREGLLHAFPRTLSFRKDDERYTPFEMSVDELGGKKGSDPIPVEAVILTRYESGSDWKPKRLSPGEAVLEMMQYTFGFVTRPDFSMPILNKIASHAIILSGSRDSADNFAKTLLEFVDKRTD